MKAVVYDRYGSPDVLRVEQLPTPTAGPRQVVVATVATSINLSDWEGLRGVPMYARIGGLRTPAHRTLGSDIAGRVTAVGADVSRFRVGDEVYGDNLDLMGGFAEYTLAAETSLAHKPKELTFAQASALPQAGAIALQGTARVGSGQRILINGAGGGSGSFAIQLAKLAGAQVTGVDNARKLEFMRSVGADEVVDYQTQDFADLVPFDHVLDLVAHRSVFTYRRALARGGRYRCVGGSVTSLLRIATAGATLGWLTGRSLGLLIVKQGPSHFAPLAERCLAGDIQIHIDRTVGLGDVPDALAYLGHGGVLGKVVVQIA